MTHIYICLQIAFSSVCPFLKLLCLSFVEICMIAFIVVVQSLRHVWLFATSCTAACQASPSLTTSRSLLKLMSIELEPSHPQLSLFPLALCLSQHRDLFQWVSSSYQVSFSFSISASNECSVLISFRMDWLGLLAVQGTLKSLLQHQSSKAVRRYEIWLRNLTQIDWAFEDLSLCLHSAFLTEKNQWPN